MEFLRFLTVSATGVAVDLGVGWACGTALGTALWLAATIGFGVAAGLNYILHLRWTFRDLSEMAAASRVPRYLLALGLTYAARLAAVLALERLLGPTVAALYVLIPSVGVSFCVSFLATKFLAFRSHDSTQRQAE